MQTDISGKEKCENYLLLSCSMVLRQNERPMPICDCSRYHILLFATTSENNFKFTRRKSMLHVWSGGPESSTKTARGQGWIAKLSRGQSIIVRNTSHHPLEMFQRPTQLPVGGLSFYGQIRTPNRPNLLCRCDARSYFNVRSKADIGQLNLPHGGRKIKAQNRKK